MAVPAILCPECQAALPPGLWGGVELRPCPACRTPVWADVFPALLKPMAVGSAGEAILIDGEAGCFYHPQRRAVVPCGSCGRFLCAVCDVDLNGRHWCPACLETARRNRSVVELDNRRVLHDSSALMLALAPVLLCWPITLLTAPCSIYLAILSFFRPGSLVSRTRVRAYLSIGIGLLQLLVWVLAFVGVFGRLSG